MAQRYTPIPHVPTSRPRPSRAAPFGLFALLSAVVLTGGALSYASALSDLRRQKERELATIADFKVREIERWRHERLSDAQAVAADPVLRDVGARRREEGDLARLAAQAEKWFAILGGHGDYSALALLEMDGGVVLAAHGHAREAAVPRVGALGRRAALERRPLFVDYPPEGPEDPPRLALVAPIVPSRGEVRHVLFLLMDPRHALFPILQSSPAPSPSAETLLVQRSADRVRVVNPLRFPAEDPDPSWIPGPGTSATPAAPGRGRVVEVLDYRSVPVLAAVEPVAATPWELVAKIDRDEALASSKRVAVYSLLATLALLLASGAGALLWWRLQVGALESARAAEEAEWNSLVRRLERLTLHSTDMILLSDENHRLVEVNERAARALCYTREELIGMPVRELRDPATLSDFDARVREQVEKGAAMFETRYRRKDGSTFPVELTVHSEVYEGRRWFQAIARDVSGRVAAEEALRDSEARFRAVFEQASVGMTLVDGTGRLIGTNRAFRELFGCSEEEAAGLSLRELRDESGGPSPSEIVARLQDGAPDSIELPGRYRRADGRMVDAILRASALRDEKGALRFVLGVFQDLTERKRIESQLFLADRMASVGTLAAGVAHEINNPLSFVLSNLDFASEEIRKGGADPEVVRALEDAKGGAVRVRAIVRDLKAFSRAGDEVREPLDVRSVLRSAIGLAANEIRQRAEIAVDPGDVPRVLASERRLAQVFLNLLINAAQAIPEGNVQGNEVRAVTGTAPDGRALIEISDTGSGIPPELRSRIFDPFFTTKPVGVGTGLGLSICHAIVTQHGGEITVDGAPGKGSTFRVLLPAAAEPPAPPSPEPMPPPRSPARRGRVMVVDDEASIGRAIRRILTPQHEVVARTSARDALEELTSNGEGFDLVLCDLMMPDMTGMELHGRLARAKPGVADRMVFLTGGAFTPAARAFLERVQNPRLEKPFEPTALRELVAQVLGETSGTAAGPARGEAPGRSR